jgi:hypothetical protein
MLVLVPWVTMLTWFVDDETTNHPVSSTIWIVWTIVGGIILYFHVKKHEKILHDGYKRLVLDMRDEFEGQGYVVDFVQEKQLSRYWVDLYVAIHSVGASKTWQ